MSALPHATIIGAQGFVGQALLRQLQAQGWQCWAPGRDVVWPQSERDLGHVFYCAGLTADYLQRAADTLEAHVGLLSRVLQSQTYTSLVYLSSTRLYDGQLGPMPTDEHSSLCVNPLQPRHLYDLSKLAGESACHVLGRGRARVVRLSCVFQDATDADGFLPALLRQVAQAPVGSKVEVASSAHYARDYVHLSDVINALVAVALRGTQPVYNVASGHNVSNAQLAQWVQSYARRTLRFTKDEQAPPPAQVHIERMHTELGWSPKPLGQVLIPMLQTLAGTA